MGTNPSSSRPLELASTSPAKSLASARRTRAAVVVGAAVVFSL
ncbi:MAG TPA: hypothetical protein VGO74_15470 [Modestobacter sp.]|nr:hypothetical protein [Modestobacter sp.]